MEVSVQGILLLIGISNLLIIYYQGHKPVFLVMMSAVLEGVLLTPVQAAVVGWVLYRVMPKFFREELRHLVRPNPIIGVGLAAAFLLFGFVLVFKLVEILVSTLADYL